MPLDQAAAHPVDIGEMPLTLFPREETENRE
jgi:hypothetical protein